METKGIPFHANIVATLEGIAADGALNTFESQARTIGALLTIPETVIPAGHDDLLEAIHTAAKAAGLADNNAFVAAARDWVSAEHERVEQKHAAGDDNDAPKPGEGPSGETITSAEATGLGIHAGPNGKGHIGDFAEEHLGGNAGV